MYKKFVKKAFTLVELIIVIAIIAVLAVSAFVVVTKWLGKSRDSRRISDVGTVERSLLTYLADYQANPTGSLKTGNVLSGVIYAGTANAFYQGPVSDNFIRNIGLDSLQVAPTDPKSTSAVKLYYILSIDGNAQRKFNVAATMEYKDSTTVGDKAIVKGNVLSGDVITYTGTTSLTFPSIIFSGNYDTAGVYAITATNISSGYASSVIDQDINKFPYTVSSR